METAATQEFLDVTNETFYDDYLVISSSEVIQVFSDHSIRLIDLSTGQHRQVFPHHSSKPTFFGMHDDKHVLSASKDQCFLWRLEDGEIVKQHKLPMLGGDEIQTVLLRSHHLLLRIRELENHIHVFDTETGMVRPSIPCSPLSVWIPRIVGKDRVIFRTTLGLELLNVVTASIAPLNLKRFSLLSSNEFSDWIFN